MHSTAVIEAISNGLGSQSMYLLLMAIRREIPATVSLTADTGSENDCLWSTGRRSDAESYFREVVEPLCSPSGVTARFVRAVDCNGDPLPSLEEKVRRTVDSIGAPCAIPAYGSRGGQQRQSCTEKWKVRALRQEARRMGARMLISAQGIHFGEAGRRVKGRPIGMHAERWNLYQDTEKKCGQMKDVGWCRHYYPLVDLQLGRKDAQEALEVEGIPYIVSSQCDFCPHKDLARWERTSPEKLIEIAALEAKMKGRFFFTDERVPLLQALEIKRAKGQSSLDAHFGCGNGLCGI